LSESELREIDLPVMIVMGTEDQIGGDPHALARAFKRAFAVDILGRDHNQTLGDKVYKDSVLDFLEQNP